LSPDTKKRLFDLAIVALASPIVIPVLLLTALAVRLSIGRPIFFRQLRTGRDGRPFQLVKFRSMTDARDRNGQLLGDSHRLGSFGRWLRSVSLDELPEILNVIKGEMSLVGPRPLFLHYLALYTPRQARRLEVKPGITGWAQVNGRNEVGWTEKFELDAWYVEHQSISLDIKILFTTVLRVIKRHGINQPGFDTAAEFRGNGDK
jgi:sugar transferase EpsL